MTSVSTDRRFGVNSSLAYKVPVVAATTANITLSGEQTIDGVSIVAGDRVLVKNQTTASQNGIYEANTSTWTRTPDFDGSYDIVSGTRVFVTSGTQTGIWYISSSNPITINNSNIAFTFSDVSLPTQSGNAGNFLTTDGSNPSWAAITESDISDLGTTIVLDTDIGVTVQGYDAGLAYFDGLNFTNEATFKAAVNLEIGTDVQAYDADLSTIAALTSTTDGLFIVGSATGWVGESGATARTSLGVYSTAEVDALVAAQDQLSELTDVTITASAANELLFTTGANTWVNYTLAEAGISAVGHTHVEADITDLQAYLLNVVEDTTPQLGGSLDAQSNTITSAGNISTATADGAAILNESASGTNPTLIPDQSDLTSGIGALLAGQVDIIANGVSGINVNSVPHVAIRATQDSHRTTDALIKLGAGTSLYSGAAAGNPYGVLTNNFYVNTSGTAVYRESSFGAGLMSFAGGQFQIQVAPTGTAGNPVTFTPAFKITTASQVSLDAGSLLMKEQTAANADVAAYGQWWVKDDAPNIPKFTDDGGTDYSIVLDTKAQTLTNKTINTASNTITVVEADISDLQAYLLNITGEPLSDLSDVTITTIASGEILKWNGSAWINNTLAEAGIAAASHTHVEADITDLQSYLVNVSEDTTPTLGGALDAGGFDINNGGVIFLTEQAAAEVDVVGKGQIWVKTATPNELMFTDDAGTDWTVAFTSDISGFLSNVVEDTTPQLGGSLDAQSNTITSAGNITVTNGNGAAILNETSGTTNPTVVANQADLTSGLGGASGSPALVVGGAAALIADSSNISITKTLMIQEGAAATADVSAYGQFWVENLIPNIPKFTDDAGNDYSIVLDTKSQTLTNKTINTASNTITVVEADISDLGAYLENVSEDTTPQLGGNLDVNGNKITSASSGNIDIEPNGTGNVLIGNFTFDADQTVGAGQDNYVLTYDNATGLISLEASAGGGLTDVVDDTTPQLGGELDAQGNDITSIGVLTLTEQAAAEADEAAHGQIWVKTATPNQLWFTDDAGNDVQLSGSGGTAGPDYLKYSEVQTAGTNGSNASAATWNTRVLNTEDNDDGGHGSLSSNQVTLAAGTYRIRAYAQTYDTSNHCLRWRNTSDSTTAIVGLKDDATGGANSTDIAHLAGEFTIASSKTFELQHYTQAAKTPGLGKAYNTGEVEVFCVVELWKVA